MQHDLQPLLDQLGLQQKEAETFLKLLQLGAKPVSVVAKFVGLPRSSMYFTLDRLKELQLIEEFERSGIKYVRCIPVRDIALLLQAKERKLKSAMQLLQEQMSQLELMENKLSVTPTVRFVEGKEAVLRMYLAEQSQWNKEWCTIYNPATVKHIAPTMLNPKTYVGDKGSSKEIIVDCPEAQEWMKNFTGDARAAFKVLPKSTHFDSDISISEDTIYMVSFGENQAAGIVIVHRQLADQMRSMFQALWNLLP